MKFIKLFIKEFREEYDKIKDNEFKKQIPNLLTLSRGLAPIVIIPSKISLNVIDWKNSPIVVSKRWIPKIVPLPKISTNVANIPSIAAKIPQSINVFIMWSFITDFESIQYTSSEIQIVARTA